MEKTPLDNWIFRKTGADLQSYQTARLFDTIARVKTHSRFYRERLANIAAPYDLTELPFTTPDDIAANPEDFVCAAPHEIERIVTLPTSGTTGRPKRIFNTREDIELTVDFFHHGMSTLARRGDRVMIFLPGGSQNGVAALLRDGLLRLGCEGIIYGPVSDYDDARTALTGCDVAVGLPSVMFALSQRSRLSLRSVLLCSDYTSPALIAAIGRRWRCEVFTHYGLTESGLGGGVECAAHAGYHMREADLLFEIIDHATGSPAPDGEYGELVFTTLTKRGMPLVRYRTGDRSRVVPGLCPCGTELRRFERVSGRIAGDIAPLSITMLDDIMYALPDLAAYAAEVTSHGLVVTVNGPCALPDVEAALCCGLPPGTPDITVRRGGDEILPTGADKRVLSDRRYT